MTSLKFQSQSGVHTCKVWPVAPVTRNYLTRRWSWSKKALLKSFHFIERIYQGRNKTKIKAYKVRLRRKTHRSVRLARQQARRPSRECAMELSVQGSITYQSSQSIISILPRRKTLQNVMKSFWIQNPHPNPKNLLYKPKGGLQLLETLWIFVMYVKNAPKLRKTIQFLKGKHPLTHILWKELCLTWYQNVPTLHVSWVESAASKREDNIPDGKLTATDTCESSQTATQHLPQNLIIFCVPCLERNCVCGTKTYSHNVTE